MGVYRSPTACRCLSALSKMPLERFLRPKCQNTLTPVYIPCKMPLKQLTNFEVHEIGQPSLDMGVLYER